MYENQNNVGQAAVEDLQELRKKIFDNPSLELDISTKRLRQANFKQQYKLRQERSSQTLTSVEQEALLACGAVEEILGDTENTETQVADPPTSAWNQAVIAGMHALPSNGDGVEGLFLAEQYTAQNGAGKQPLVARAKVCNRLYT